MSNHTADKPPLRSNRREVRNPLLKLAAVAAMCRLSPEARSALAQLCREISSDAAVRAEYSWRKHKAPMAAYWKAVSVYAKHTARAIQTRERRAA